MKWGLTRAEQAAMVGVIVLIGSGLAVQGWRSRAAPSEVWVEPGEQWQPVTAGEFAAGLNSPAQAAGGTRSSKHAEPSPASIDVNSASAEELERLPGIGPAKARAVIGHREKFGGFSGLDQLTDVPGISPAVLDRIRPYLFASTEGIAPSKPASPRPLERADSPSHGGRSEAPEPIRINSATVDELQRIPGVGPRLAARIVEHRRTRPFRRVEDLTLVSGIGPRNLEPMRPWVRLD